MLPPTEDLPELKVTVFNTGWVEADKRLVVTGASKAEVRMPALFAMIRHPEKGIILYDTGYSTRFYEATSRFPYSVMRKLTPAEIREEDNADRQLEKTGVKPEDVKTIILGHGHADHVPGVAYFPQARVIVDRKEWSFMQGNSLRIFRKAYLKSLYSGLKNPIEMIDFAEQGRQWGPFERAIDLMNDGSMILIPLPGHTAGQTGLMVNMPDGRRFFFVGDAAWVTENYIEMKPPSPLVRSIWSSSKDYMASLHLIHEFNKSYPDVVIVPAHCPATWERLVGSGLQFSHNRL